MYFNNLKTIYIGKQIINEDKRDEDGILSKIQNVFSRETFGVFLKLNFLEGKLKNLKSMRCQKVEIFFTSKN